jgi:hypothetical protein
MTAKRSEAALALLLLCGCTAEAAGDAQEVRALVEQFQQAILRGDAPALAPMLTVESRRVLGELPLTRAAGRRPLELLRVDGGRSRYLVTLRDPNLGGATAHFVVVREGGALVVDLVATGMLGGRTVRTGPPRWQLVPGDLDPASIRRAEAEFAAGR